MLFSSDGRPEDLELTALIEQEKAEQHAKGMKKHQSLAVIIPSGNSLNLASCIAAVRACDPGLRIIVVDDGLIRDDRPIDMRAGDAIVTGARPFVFARNCNIGMWLAGDADVILLNDDALLQTPGGFTALQRAAQEQPEFGVIGAVTNVTGQPLQQPQNIGLREIPHVAFVCVLIPRQTLDLVGLLDERYCLDYGCEDLDYCQACTRAGLKVGVFDGCFVDHSSLVSTFRGDPHAPKDYSQNLALYHQKWGAA